MASGMIPQIVLPMALFMIMLGVGMSMRFNEFSAIWHQPRAVLSGLLAQLLLLPALGWLVVSLLKLPPELAVGIMILTFAPGGATSNMITLLARGDTALSVSLTAISGLITPFTLPVLTGLALAYWMGDKAAISFPVLETIMKLLLVALVPAVIGAMINHRWPSLCKRLEKFVKVLACLFLIFVVTAIVGSNWEKMPELITVLGPAVLLLVTLAMTTGFMIARKLTLKMKQSVTLGVEVGIQNAAIALMVTGGILHNPEMSASALIYGVLMNIPAFLLIVYRNWPQRSIVGRSV